MLSCGGKCSVIKKGNKLPPASQPSAACRRPMCSRHSGGCHVGCSRTSTPRQKLPDKGSQTSTPRAILCCTSASEPAKGHVCTEMRNAPLPPRATFALQYVGERARRCAWLRCRVNHHNESIVAGRAAVHGQPGFLTTRKSVCTEQKRLFQAACLGTPRKNNGVVQ